MPEHLFINDDNASQFLDAHHELTDGLAGVHPEAELDADGRRQFELCCAPFNEVIPLIPKSEWMDRAKALAAVGGFANQKRRALSKRLGHSVVKSQGRLNYCHLYDLANCMEHCRDQAGLPYVELAPETMGGAVRWANAGGSMNQDMAYVSQHGCATRAYADNWVINPKQFKSGWEENAKLHVPVKWFKIGHSGDVWAEVVTALLSGFCVYSGFTWWTHAVMSGMLVPNANGRDLDNEIENSWDTTFGNEGYAILQGAHKVPSIEYGIYVPTVMTYSAA